MEFTDSLISIVNTHISNKCLCDPRFENGQIDGIAYDSTVNDSVVRQYPTIVDLNGEGRSVSIDDTYSIQIYHRILGNRYDTIPGYGDRDNIVKKITDVKMVVAGRTDRLLMRSEDLEALITSNFPDNIPSDQFSDLKIRRMYVRLLSSNMNKEQIFKEEYKGLKYDAKPEQILFYVLYQIESEYKKPCFSITDCQAVAN